MESVCPIDENCASEVSALLRPPSPAQLQEYLDELISKRNCHGIKIKQNSQLGKGVYADLDFQEEELILKDQMLAGIQHSSNKMDCLVCSFCFRFIGSVELQIGRKLYLQRLGDSANDKCTGTFSHNLDDCYESDSSDVEDDSHAHMHEDFGNCVSSSSKDNKISLPEGVIESLMNGELALPFSNRFPLPSTIPCHGGCGEAYYCSKACAEADWESFHSLLCIGERSEAPSRAALMKFIEHANGTNDIFLLAAKAWKPISVGYKRRWWDCIALPDDVDPSDESSFRMQIRELALTSLQLLKAAIFDKECEPLFSLEIYGQIIGMFELNNLDLVVASPVEDYFLYIDDLPHSVKRDAEKITRPILDALGDDYSICCQGTAFFPLQSCMNHSCCPNAKAFKREEDRDGQATIIAQRPISKGEEVTISYIDEDLPYEERQSLLADYGFKCRCPKCLEDEVILDNRLYRSRSLCFEKDERTGIQ